LSIAKEKQGKERLWRERKEKKRGERRSTYQSCGSLIFKSKSKPIVKRSWSETWREYKRI
jgi:hypothetical protein